ncbi:MAG: helix-turn-helix transcriptional regulator [Flavobacteriaceae bacterium]|nr:helix-turn-helix transcriptional regulator [Flavobacteriaceae bacterium]
MTDFKQPNNQTTTTSYLKALKILSPREIEVLEFVERGYSNKEVSEELSLSVRTIDAHKRHICDKLNLKGRSALQKWIWRVKYDDSDY